MIYSKDDDDEGIEVNSISLSSSEIEIDAGNIEYLTLTINPSSSQKKVIPKWTFDNNFVSVDGSSYGASIKGLHEGNTFIKVEVQGISKTCLVKVKGDVEQLEDEQYIYSDTSVLEMISGDTRSVSVSLFAGSENDLNQFVWSINDSSVATFEASRNNCLISAKSNGTTILTATHPNCKYPYSIVIFSHQEGVTSSYITTDQNVVSINSQNSSSKTVTFNVVNPISALSENKFSFEDITDEKSKGCFSFTAVNNQVVIVPKFNGLGCLKVHNEECENDLEILVKVRTSVDSVYLSTSTSTLTVDGIDSYTISANLEGYEGIVDSSLYKWEIDKTYKTTKPISELCDWFQNENTVSITGKENGIFRFKVSHPLSSVSKQVLVILQNQKENSVDSSMYITTTSNFVSTKVGNEETVINVNLVGGKNGDENDFTWSVKQNENVINLETSTGSISSQFSRAAIDSGTCAYGSLHITPLNEGTATIYVGHKKCLYETEILVRVYSKETLLTEPISIECEKSVLKILNGNSQDFSVNLKNASIEDENKIEWQSYDSSKVSVSSNGKSAILKACGNGQNQAFITIKHPKAISEKRILVLTADSEKELLEMKAIFATNTYFRINENKTAILNIETLNFSESDLQNISWQSSDSSIANIESFPNGKNKDCVKIIGIKKGQTQIIASSPNCSDVIFDIVVLGENEETEVVNSKYLTTYKNAVVITEKNGGKAKLEISGVNMSDSDLVNTTWKEIDNNLLQISGNGSTCEIVSLGNEGRTRVKAINPKSQNEIIFDVKIGSYYEYEETLYPYIISEKDTYSGLVGDELTIGFSLENTDSVGNWDFSITEGLGKTSIISQTQGKQVTCSVKLNEAGLSTLRVSNSLCDFSKEILFVIANSIEELEKEKFLTTSQNVVILNKNSSKSISVRIVNATENIVDGYSWTSSDNNITIASSGATALVTANKVGTSKITVKSKYCAYPLSIIVNVVEEKEISENPYITSSSIINLKVGEDYTSVIADLVGGSESDYKDFKWTCDSSNVDCKGQNETGFIKALSSGTALVTISHPKASANKTILVICENVVFSNLFISVNQSLITLQPNSSSTTINATLVNGTDEDIYDFEWWADDYSIVKMNVSASSCTITPLNVGSTNIYVKHRKTGSKYKKICVSVTQYTDFSFSADHISAKEGKTTFAKLEVPTTTNKTYVIATSSDSSIATIGAATNELVSIIGKKEGSAIIKATLYDSVTKTVLGKSELLVYVEKADIDEAYISVNNGYLMTVTRSDSAYYTISASVKNASYNIDYSNMTFEYDTSSNIIVPFTSDMNPNVRTGNSIMFYAKNVGDIAVKIKYADSKTNANLETTMYVIVQGNEDPSISLNYDSLTLAEKENAVNLKATVSNAKQTDVLWAFYSEDMTTDISSTIDLATMSGSGSSVSITPLRCGSFAIKAYFKDSVGSSSCAWCQVTIKQAASLSLSIDRFSILPYDQYKLEYTVIPPTDSVTWTWNDSSFASIISDFSSDSVSFKSQVESCLDSEKNVIKAYTVKDGVKYTSYPNKDGKGVVTICGRLNSGSTTLTGTTSSLSKASCIVSNNLANEFTVGQTILNMKPSVAVSLTNEKSQSLENGLKIKYTVAPYNAVLAIRIGEALSNNGSELNYDTSGYSGSEMFLKTDSELVKFNSSHAHFVSNDVNNYQNYNYIILAKDDASKYSEEEYDAKTGVRTGYITLGFTKAFNGKIYLDAYNPERKISSTETVVQRIGTKEIKVCIAYDSSELVLRPYIPKTNSIGVKRTAGKYSDWNDIAKSFVMADGESLEMQFDFDKSLNPYQDVLIDYPNIALLPSGKSSLKLNIGSKNYLLQGTAKDFIEKGWTATKNIGLVTSKGREKTDSERSWLSSPVYEFENMYLKIPTTSNKLTLNHCIDYNSSRPCSSNNGYDNSDIVQYNEQIGILRIPYKDLKTMKYKNFDYKVFVQVRNDNSTGRYYTTGGIVNGDGSRVE